MTYRIQISKLLKITLAQSNSYCEQTEEFIDQLEKLSFKSNRDKALTHPLIKLIGAVFCKKSKLEHLLIERILSKSKKLNATEKIEYRGIIHDALLSINSS
mmetsp:Transcript_10684/g.12017  ORF Transcript_10684/g.12017 Transcript_10684/m.12017 type:complete len:101 (+) Transcript_10684:792-1094(+)